jgi:hypothetical protein
MTVSSAFWRPAQRLLAARSKCPRITYRICLQKGISDSSSLVTLTSWYHHQIPLRRFATLINQEPELVLLRGRIDDAVVGDFYVRLKNYLSLPQLTHPRFRPEDT